MKNTAAGLLSSHSNAALQPSIPTSILTTLQSPDRAEPRQLCPEAPLVASIQASFAKPPSQPSSNFETPPPTDPAYLQQVLAVLAEPMRAICNDRHAALLELLAKVTGPHTQWQIKLSCAAAIAKLKFYTFKPSDDRSEQTRPFRDDQKTFNYELLRAHQIIREELARLSKHPNLDEATQVAVLSARAALPSPKTDLESICTHSIPVEIQRPAPSRARRTSTPASSPAFPPAGGLCPPAPATEPPRDASQPLTLAADEINPACEMPQLAHANSDGPRPADLIDPHTAMGAAALTAPGALPISQDAAASDSPACASEGTDQPPHAATEHAAAAAFDDAGLEAIPNVSVGESAEVSVPASADVPFNPPSDAPSHA